MLTGSKRVNKKLWYTIVVSIAAFICTFSVVCGFIPVPTASGVNPFIVERPLLIAHGGGNAEFPDNTLEAYYNAYSVSKDVMMETDVCITADGVLILSHDVSLERKTNASGLIEEITYADLMAKEVDFGLQDHSDLKYVNYLGARVSPLSVSYPEGVTARHSSKFLATTFEQLLTAFPNSLINAEIKQKGETGKKALQEMLRLLAKYNAFERVVLASFHREAFLMMKEAKQQYPALMFSADVSESIAFYAADIFETGCFYHPSSMLLQIPYQKAGLRFDVEKIVREAHSHNMAVHYWTVNDIELFARLVKIGADGIMTDKPSLLNDYYRLLYASN